MKQNDPDDEDVIANAVGVSRTFQWTPGTELRSKFEMQR